MNGWVATMTNWWAGLPAAPEWALLLAKITLLLGLGWLLHGLFARANPRWRVLVWRLVMLGVAALPLTMWVGLPIRLSLPVPPPAATPSLVDMAAGRPEMTAPMAVPDGARARGFNGSEQFAGARRRGAGTGQGTDMNATASSNPTLRPTAMARNEVKPAPGTVNFDARRWLPALGLALWGGVALALALRWAAGWRRLARLAREAMPAPEALMHQLEHVAAGLGCHPAELRLDGRISTPLIFGWRRPVLLLPARMAGPEYRGELPAILAHELSHLRGGDLLWTQLLAALRIALWFHPLAWGVGRAHAAACEEVSDAAAAAYVGDAGAYSRTLARVAVELAERPTLAGAIAMARVPEVMRRLDRLSRRVFANPLSRRRAGIFILTLALGVGLLGGLRFAYAERKTTPAAKGAKAAQEPTKTADRKSEPAKNAKPAARARGAVLDTQGRPVTGARVALVHRPGPSNVHVSEARIVEEAHTGADGAYAFQSPLKYASSIPHDYARDVYSVVATHPAHALAWVNIREGKEPTSCTLTLTTPTSATLTVTDMNGKPLAGARVWPYSFGTRDSANPLFRDSMTIEEDLGLIGAATDAQGKAVITSLPAANCSYYAALKGYATGLAFRPGRIRLVKGATVRGAVTLAGGKPVADAVIRFSADYMSDHRTVRTDAQGNYAMEDLAPEGWDMSPWGKGESGNGKYNVSVASQAGTANGAPIQVKPGEVIDNFDFILEQGTLVKCRVVELGTDRPLAGARLGGENAGKRLNGYSDAEGIFSFRALPGSVQLTFDSPPDGFYIEDYRQTGLPYPRVQFEAKGEKMEVTLDAPPLGGRLVPLKGRVLGPDGAGVAGVTVNATAGSFQTATTTGYVPSAKTDNRGAFELPNVPEGLRLFMHARTRDRRLAAVAVVDLPRGVTIPEVTLRLNPTTTGTVVLHDDEGNPVKKGFRVEIWPTYNGDSISIGNDIFATADENGMIKVGGIIPGLTYQLQDGEVNHGRSREFREIQESRIQLAPGPAPLPGERAPASKPKTYNNTLMGRVVNAAGQPVAGARIRVPYTELLPKVLRKTPVTSVTVHQDGAFTLERLAEGELQLITTAEGYKPQCTIAPTRGTVQIELHPVGEPVVHDVQLTDEAGQPLADAPVTLWRKFAYNLPSPAPATETRRTDAQGKVRFESNPAFRLPGSEFSYLICDLPGRDLALASASLEGDGSLHMVASRSGKHWSGQVFDPVGKPIRGAVVQVWTVRPNINTFDHVEFDLREGTTEAALAPRAVTGEDGRFELPRLTLNHGINAFVWAPGFAMQQVFFFPEGRYNIHEPSDKRIVLLPGGTVEGKLVMKGSGKPFPHPELVRIQFRSESGRNTMPLMKIEADGTFRSESFGRSHWMTDILFDGEAHKYVCAAPPRFEATPGKTTRITVEVEEGLPLTGRLVDAVTGQGVIGFASAVPKGEPKDNTYRSATAEDGTWTLYLPGEGDYLVQGVDSLEGKPGEPKQVTVKRGKAVEDVVFRIGKDGK